MEDGSCDDCAPYSRASPDQKTCRPDACDRITQVLKFDGSCETCPDYERPLGEDGLVCGPDRCNRRQKLLKNGKCETCPPTFAPSLDGKECDKVGCYDNEKELPDKSCARCLPFQKGQKVDSESKVNTFCASDKCTWL